MCVIDLDTFMPGYFISDMGDMLRTYLSPFSEEEKDFSKVEIREDPETTYIFLKVNRRLIKVGLSSILYVEGWGDYLKVHTTDQTYITYMTMGKPEALLPASKFKGYICNSKYIFY